MGQFDSYLGDSDLSKIYQILGAGPHDTNTVILASDLLHLHNAEAQNGLTRTVKLPLAAVDTAGGIFSWQNPESKSIIVSRIIVDVTTPATSACTLKAGATAVSATTLSNNLLDSPDIHTTARLFDNVLAADAGTNGKPSQKVASGSWVTGSTGSGAAAGLVGSVLISYIFD